MTTFTRPAELLAHTDHRPWPLPAGPWIMTQRWQQLLFAHWPIAPDVMRALVPPQLELDLFEGQAWLGVVPFRMTNVRPRGIPALPWLSAFPELNVRTYVRAANGRTPKPGVYFFSLDAANPIAVMVARALYRLPYFRAKMTVQQQADLIQYRSQRTHGGAPTAELTGQYGSVGPVYTAAAGTLEQWLTERYCLYTIGRREKVLRGEIHHKPWPLQPAQAHFEVNTMAAAAGLALPDTPPLLHFAASIDVLVWPIAPVT
ncbi:MAG: DUF2071 domain-containing protein [Caldilineaceae bacterium]|nr:DUF2071 domain-containing protein [Caldilineaceae bacterium]